MMSGLPRSPLHGRTFNAGAVMEEAEEAQVQPIEGEFITADEDVSDLTLGKTGSDNIETQSVNISSKRRENTSRLRSNTGEKTLSDLLDGEGSLQSQLGLDDITGRMASPCLVCAKPRKQLEQLEYDLFVAQLPYKHVADKYQITMSDLNSHVEDCVLNRRTVIPAGSLVQKLVNEIHEFIERLDAFRMELDSSMTTESISMYLSVISQLQSSVAQVIKMKSPDDDAIVVVKQVLNPMVLNFVREVAKSVSSLENRLEPDLLPTSKAKVHKDLVDYVRSIGISFTARLVESVRKYCEVTGVNPDVILGDMAIPNRDDD